MLPNRVSNPGPLTYESGALLIALRGPPLWKFHSQRKPKKTVKVVSLVKRSEKNKCVPTD